jgi:hypothetical protein
MIGVEAPALARRDEALHQKLRRLEGVRDQLGRGTNRLVALDIS